MTTLHRRRALIETFEPRILYSADAGPAGVLAATLGGEQQLLGDPAGAARHAGGELVFIDARVPDVQQLLDDIAAQQRAGRAIEAVMVSADEDGIARIGATLAARSDVSAVHVVGHGSAGVAQLGATALDARAVFERAGEIAAWGDALDADADLLLYGCDVGADASGQQLTTALAQLTGADVAASDDPTGSALLGGDWTLEVRTGAIEAAPFASATLQADWSGVLGLTPQGTETLVNTSTGGTQTNNWSSKTVAMDANGNYVVVWMDDTGLDGSGIGVYAQRYNAGGTAQGGQFLVNTVTADNQKNPQVAMSSGGGFVVTWESMAQDGGNSGVYAKRYDASGVVQGAEFRVNTTTTLNQQEPAVAMDANGNFVIAWESENQDAANTYGIYAQRYDSSGNALGGEFLVNTYTTGDQHQPSVAMDATGNFVVAWQSEGQDGSSAGVYAQRFNSSGARVGSEFRVNTTTNNSQDLPVVAMDGSGHFVVVWESYTQDGDQQGIYGQRYDAAGATVGSEFRINVTTANQQQNPVVAMTNGGGFAVTWQSYAQDGSLDGVYVRAYDSSGNPYSGTDTLVNTTTTNIQDVPSIAADANGHLVVAWHGNGSGDTEGIFTQRYTYAVAPVITLSGYSGTYVENASVIYDASATVTDADTPVFNGGTLNYAITANGSSADELGIRNVGSGVGQIGLSGSTVTYGGTVIGTYSGSAGAGSFGNGSTPLTVSLNNNATVAAVQALVRSVTFRNTSENPSTATRTINLSVSDGTGMTSAPAVVTMAVTAVNDPPVITSAATASVAENTTAVLTVTSTDVDGGTPSYSIVGGADQARFQINSSTGALSFASAPDYEAPTDVGANNVYDVTVQVSDGAGGTATQAIAVTVTDVPSTLIVTTTADTNDTGLGTSFTAEQLNASKGTDGKISLREAIIAANNTPGIDTISFNIADALVNGTHTIQPTSTLPTLTAAVVIDGTTEPDYVVGRPVVEIDGGAAGSGAHGLVLGAGAGGSTIRGLAINNFDSGHGYGLYLMAGADNNVVTGNVIGLDADGTTTVATPNNYGIYVVSSGNTIGGTTAATRNVLSGNLNGGLGIYGSNNVVIGNFIGTDATGTLDRGNQMDGVDIFGGSNNRIGGTTAAERNIISGNDRNGLEIGSTATGTLVQGNYIGTDVNGTLSLGNSMGGIWLGTGVTGVTIGGTAAGAGNRIVNNPVGGVYSDTSNVSFALLGNTFYNNANLAIDLKNDGVTANDAGDADSGPNGLQNFPVLTRARVVSASQISLAGTLSSAANAYYRIEFYANAVQDGSGYGEGQRYLGYVNVATDGTGSASFDTLVSAAVSSGEFVSATATLSNAGYSAFTATSEFAANLIASQAPFVTATAGTVAFTEGGGAVVIDATLDVGDADSANLVGATVSVASGFVAGQDVLAFVDQGGITGSWNASTGVLTLSGSASVASYRTALRSVTYAITGDTPTAGTRGIAFVASDGSGTGNPATRSVAVGAVNDAPSFNAADFLVGTPVGSGAERGYATTVQPDGKILVAGYSNNGSNNDFLLLRFNADGTLDTSFGGGDGIVTTAIGTGDDEARAVAVQSDGKILVAGFSMAGAQADFALARYLADGTLDTSFGGGDGIVTTDFGSGSDDRAWSMAVQSDGRIVLGGSSALDFAVARYTTDGSLDTSFSGDGKQRVDIAGSTDDGNGLALQADGRIVQAGVGMIGTTQDFVAVRYNTDGSLDTSFGGGDGIVTTPVGASFDIAQSVAVQADGKILVGGYYWSGSDNDFALLRYTSAGVLDTSFGGGDGIATLDFAGGLDAAWGLVVQPDGKILLSGSASSDMALARFLTDGTPDTSFSGDGRWTAHLGGNSILYATALTGDGRIVGTGYTTVGGTDDVLTIRLAADGTPDVRANPSGSSLGGSVAFTENGAPVTLASDARVFDAELSGANNFNGATLGLARSGGANAQDVFSAAGNLGSLTQGGNLTLGGVVIGTVTTQGGGSLLFTFNANATQARVDEVLNSLAYANTSDAPPASVQLVWTFSDGNSGSQGSGGALAATATSTVNITAVNDPPTITSANTANVAENTTAVLTVTASDVDGGTPVYAIVGGADMGKFQIDASTGALSFKTAPDYEAPADAGADNVYDVSVQVSDGAGGFAIYAIAVTVTPVNDNAPTVTSPAAVSVAENTTAVTTVTASDADLPAQALSYSIVGGADQARFVIDAISGALRFVVAPDFEAPTDVGGDNIYNVTVQASDGSFTATRAIAVTVTDVASTLIVDTTADVNDTGLGTSFTAEQLNASKGADGKISLREAIIAANNTAGIDTIRFNIAGSGPQTITLASALPTLSEGVLIDGRSQSGFAGTPLVVLDGNGTVANGLEITGSNTTVRGLALENFASRGILVSGGAANTLIVGNYIGTDAGGLTAHGNGDWGIDVISAGAGTVIGGTTALDRNVIVGNAGQGGVAINDTPGATIIGNYIGVGADGTTALGNDQGVLVINHTAGTRIGGTAAGEGNVIANNAAAGILLWPGASQASVLGNRIYANGGQAIDLGADGPTANDAGDADSGANDLQNYPVLTSAVSGSGQIVIAGTLDSVASGYYRIEFFADTSPDASGHGEARTLLGSTNVVTDASGNASFNVTLGVSVGAGTAVSATATLSNAAYSSFLVTSEMAANVTASGPNVAPAGTDGSVAATEDTTYTFKVADFGFTDSDGNALKRVWIDTLPAAGSLLWNGSSFVAGNWVVASDIVAGKLTYQPAANSNASTSFTFRVQDDGGTAGGGSDTDPTPNTLTINIAAVNDPPVITSAATASVAENTTAVLTVTSTDVDGGTPTYAVVGGADMGKFQIDASSGALSFKVAPDFDVPGDADGNNVYDVQVQVSDGAGGSATQTIAVTLTPVNDNAPVFTSTATPSVAENATAVMTVTASDADQPAQTLTYSIVGGADQARFSISSAGVLSFVSAPDYEAPADAGGNNVYDVDVQVSDGTFTATQSIAVSVTPVNEFAPTITSNGAGATASLSMAENGTVVTTVTATDADHPGDVLTYTIVGGADAGKFQIDAATGLLHFVVPPDYENPTDSGANNVYDVTVQVSDGTHTDTQAIAVTVTNVVSELVVTTAADTADGDTSSIANLINNKGADGKISLREAILAANNTAGADVITFAIGSGAHTINLTAALPTITSVIHIDGDSQPGFAGQPLIDLNGAAAGSSAIGLYFSGSGSAGSSVRGLAVNGFHSSGIRVESTSNVTIAGNYLGTNLAGTASSGNQVGVVLYDASNNTIGGTTAADRNLISGNTVDGVQIFGTSATGNLVAGNYIGLDVTGSVDLGNTNQGVAIFGGASNNTVGGTAAGARNVISGNDMVGVRINDAATLGNVVAGNYLGTNAAGTAAVGNSLQGVQIDAAAGNTIGGTTAGAGNLISGNLADGVLIMNGAVNNVVQGNLIGLDVSGANVIGNGQEGIEVSGGATGTWIGGTTAFTRNLIAGNAYQGIGVYGTTTDNTVIRGNWIGVAADGSTARGNAEHGILVGYATRTMIGGSNAGEGNVIANAAPGYQGVVVYGGATGVTIIGNSIYGNGALGIDLEGDGVTLNDAGDADSGANNLQNMPVLASATTTGSQISIAGTLDSLASTHFRVEFFANPTPDVWGYGQGRTYLGFVDVLTDAGGHVAFGTTLAAAVPTGQVVTATATRLTAGMDFVETSEFAADIYTNAPVITSNGGGDSATVTVAENITAVTTVAASDPDGAAQTLVYSLVGGADQSRFTLDSSTGVLAFVTAPNFEAPGDANGDNHYEVIVQVADGTGAVDTQTLSVAVTNVNDAPVISFVSGSASYPENAGPVEVAPSAVVADEDSPTFNGGRMVVEITANGQPEDRLAIRNQGSASGQIGLSGASVTYGGVVIGSWSGGTGGSTPLVVSLNANATLAAVQALARNITYENVSDNPSGVTRSLAGYVEDGAGGTSNVATGTLTVIPANDAPTITSDGGGASASVSVAELSTAVTTVVASDPDSATLTYSIAGGADAALFAIDSSTGGLRFIAAPDFENPADSGADNIYDVIVKVDDGAGGSDTQAIAVTVTGVNDNAPVFASPAAVGVAENTTAVLVVHATDADLPAQTLTYSIVGGADAGRFLIDASTGALRFASAPDFEAPADAGADNVYDLIVRASDGDGLATDQAIAVTVTDVNDAPVIGSDGGGPSVSVAVDENTTAVTTVLASDADQPAQTLTYSIVGGADAALFVIDSSTGALRFAAAPDFENPADSGADNIYDVIVGVADGAGGSDTQAIAVSVRPVNDNAPVITSNGGGNSAAIALVEGTLAVTTATASDADQPAQALVWSISGADAARFSIDAATGALRFVSAPAYDTPTDANGDGIYDVTVSVADPGGLTDSQALAVTVQPALGVVVTPTSGLTTTEAGGTATFTVRLHAAPTADVVIAVTSSNPAEGTASVSQLTFTASNWNVAQSVTVTGVDDTHVDGAVTYQILLGPAVSADAAYQGVDPADVTLANLDDDTVSRILVTTTSDVADGDTSSIAALMANQGADGRISLREALLAANNSANGPGGADRIGFALPGAPTGGAWTVTLGAALPTVTDAVEIDATTQPGFAGTPVVALDGAGGNFSAITLGSTADGSLVRGLLIHNFGYVGIDVQAGADHNTVVGNWIGAIDASGAYAAGAGLVYPGITVNGSHNQIGGSTAADRNIVVGDARHGIAIGGSDNRIQGNYVGVLADGVTTVANGGHGIFVWTTATDTLIGGTAPGEGNLIAGNSGSGIGVFGTTPARIAMLGNAYWDNGVLAIDLGADGVTPNDPGDTDSGANDLQNFPVLDQLVTNANSALRVAGHLDAQPAAHYLIQLYATGTPDASGYGEGRTLVDSFFVTTDAAGLASFTRTVAGNVPVGARYSATATVTDATGTIFGGTSEFGANRAADGIPVITSNGGGDSAAISVAENVSAVTTVTATNPNAAPLVFSIVGGADAARFQIDAATGALRFVSPPDFEAPGDAGADQTYDVIVQVDDGIERDTQAIAVTVTPVNDNAPVITSSATAAVAENATAVMTVTATDADRPAQPLTYSIVGGADAALFQIDATTGVLSFIAAPDYEAPLDATGDNRYELIVRASDNAGLATDQAIVVTVTPENDNAPVITSPAAVDVAENTTAVLTVRATDADQPAQTLSYHIDGGADAALFQIDATTGVLRFVAAPDFELPGDADGDNRYDVVVAVSDGGTSSRLALTVTVANRNEMPHGSDARIALDEDSRHVLTLADFGFDDPLDLPANRLDAVQIVSAPGRGSLLLAGVAVVDGQWVSAADIVAGRLVFAPAADANGNAYASLGFRVRDDGGTTDGGIDTEAGTHTLVFDVTPVNDAPVAQADRYTGDEDTPLVVAGPGVLANDGDTEGDPLVAELVAGPAHGSLALAADGSFRYTPTADWNGTDSFSYRSFDGSAYSAPVTVSLVVRPVNDAPTMVRADLKIVQGGATTVGTDAIVARDVDSADATLRFVVDAVGNGHFELAGIPGVAVAHFDYADLAAGRVRFVHDNAAFLPTATLHVSDGQLDSAPLAASVSYGASVVPPPPAPPVVAVPDPGPASPIPGSAPATPAPATTAPPSATDPAKPAGKPAVGLADALAPAPGTTARAPGGLDVPAEAPRFVGDVSGGGAVRRFATDVSLVKINRAQITLTLGAGSEGPLMEFMLGSDDKRTAASAASARQASAEKAKLPPLDDDAYADVRVVLNAAELSGIALSVGAVWWATRAGGLVASLLMAAPAWRTFDPLPVLGPQDEEEGGDWGETMDDEMEKDEMAAADVFDDRDVTRGGA